MSDVQASGGGSKGAPDGTNTTDIGGKSGGESSGGAYPNPQTGKKPQDGFMGHGGQTDVDYRGGGDEDAGDDNENAATGS